ncbi:MAG TPA: VOC family protein [Jiangellales bacterium]|nr:VOC family protein [Jiangellales bacterium]
MSRMIFVNLPVADLAAATAFYRALGFEQNLEYSDDTASCIVVDDRIYVMLLTDAKFREFITGEISDPATTEVLTCLTVHTREEADDLVRRAIDAGGKPWKEPLRDGPMYATTCQDLDGHVWEFLAMDHAGA